jgi:hypothetical protein
VSDVVMESRARISFRLAGQQHPLTIGPRPAVRLRKAMKILRGL